MKAVEEPAVLAARLDTRLAAQPRLLGRLAPKIDECGRLWQSTCLLVTVVSASFRVIRKTSRTVSTGLPPLLFVWPLHHEFSIWFQKDGLRLSRKRTTSCLFFKNYIWLVLVLERSTEV